MREDLAPDYGACWLSDQSAGAPNCGRARTSTAKTRRSGSVQVECVERDECERAEVLGAVVELAASGPQGCEVSAGVRLARSDRASGFRN